jgi:BirA family biotin operon repressor/biotin-[acetyl-CoA-carboxylase] ligase
MNLQQVSAALQQRNLPYTLQVEQTLASTNTTLLEQARMGQAPNHCLVALNQTQGRGRQGKTWLSSAEGSLTFSVLTEFDPQQHPATTLPLKAALALAQCLKSDHPEISLKWPNDVLNQGRKVAGILVELAEPRPGTQKLLAVVGVGINLALPESIQDEIPTPATAVTNIGHTELLLRFLQQWQQQLELATDEWIADWNSLCIHQQREVRLINPTGQEQTGISQGVDRHGQLILKQAGALVSVHSGELSLRIR